HPGYIVRLFGWGASEFTFPGLRSTYSNLCNLDGVQRNPGFMRSGTDSASSRLHREVIRMGGIEIHTPRITLY
ncbi:MAG: hypothetical protein ABW107_23515, partial [Candidatus Thiodiazotropha sp. 6PLUC5]